MSIWLREGNQVVAVAPTTDICGMVAGLLVAVALTRIGVPGSISIGCGALAATITAIGGRIYTFRRMSSRDFAVTEKPDTAD